MNPHYETLHRGLSKQEQRLLNLFAFTIAWPPFSILVNLSFYFFLILVYLRFKKGVNPFHIVTNKQRLFLIFFVFAVISTLFVPEQLIEDRYFADLRLLFNYFYWTLIAVFLISNKTLIDIYQFSKYYLFGSLFLIASFFVFDLPQISTLLIEFPVITGRNVFVYQLVNIVPIAIIYVKTRWNSLITLIVLIFYLTFMFLSHGRAGSIVLLIQSFILFLAIFSRYSGLWKTVFLLLVVGFFYIASPENHNVRGNIADIVQPLNPRLSEMIKDAGSGRLEYDESFIIRDLMVKKGMKAFKEHPLLGIGVNRFRNYEIEFKDIFRYEPRLRRIGSLTEDDLNDTAPHNSYIQILAENGILGSIVFFLILWYPLKSVIRKILSGNLTITDGPQIALVGLVIYLYAISSYPTAITYVTIGLAYNNID